MERKLWPALLGLALLGSAAPAPAPSGPGEFAGRRQEVLRKLEGGVLLVRGAADDAEEEFLANRDFLYLTGIDEPGGTLLLAPEGVRVRGEGEEYYGGPPHREILFLPEATAEEKRWDGARLGPGERARALSGVETILPAGRLDRVLGDVLRRVDVLHVSAAVGSTGGDREFLRGLQDRFFWLGVRDAGRLIHPMRTVKSPAEVERIQRAIDLTGEGIREVLKQARPGMLESEVEGILGEMFLARGARFAFPTIVGSGVNSTVLHYRRNRDPLDAGEVVVLDAGARVDGYASDVSRTFPVTGSFSPRQAEIYRIVLEAQRAGIAAVRPGATLGEIHAAAFRVIRDAGYGEAFIHGTTHHLGLDVHDVGDLLAPLPPGAVITVEPGIYLPEEALGVRIEDVVLVTEQGGEVLSDGIPRTPDAIESAMARP